MAIFPQWFQIPRPRKFLFVMSLRTGVEMVSFSMIFNKVVGFYGLLAILTGLKLNPMQLSMYIYSVTALTLTAFLMPHIRKQSPLQCLTLAWLYVLDTVINCAYTIAFAFMWFLTISTNNSDIGSDAISGAPGPRPVGDAADLTSPKYNASRVDVIGGQVPGLTKVQDAVAIGANAVSTAVTVAPTTQPGFELAESIPSLTIIVLLTLIRVYFILVTMAYARQVLRLNTHAAPATVHLHTDGSSDLDAGGPFASNRSFGQMWKGRLGRAMIYPCRGYFLDEPVQEVWPKGMNSKFKTLTRIMRPWGTFERESGARSGIEPLPLSIKVIKPVVE